MGLIDSFKDEILDEIESAIDTDPEREEVKAELNKLIDWLDSEVDFPGPDWMTVRFLKSISSYGVDGLAKALDDGEQS